MLFSSLGRKDTVRNIEETGEFVINFSSEALMHQINNSSAPFEHGKQPGRPGVRHVGHDLHALVGQFDAGEHMLHAPAAAHDEQAGTGAAIDFTQLPVHPGADDQEDGDG